MRGSKSRNDRIDSEKIAAMLRGDMFPVAFVYPKQMRATRDLLRRRVYFVRHQAELYTHTHERTNRLRKCIRNSSAGIARLRRCRSLPRRSAASFIICSNILSRSIRKSFFRTIYQSILRNWIYESIRLFQADNGYR